MRKKKVFWYAQFQFVKTDPKRQAVRIRHKGKRLGKKLKPVFITRKYLFREKISFLILSKQFEAHSKILITRR